jgi:hypothetical protein
MLIKIITLKSKVDKDLAIISFTLHKAVWMFILKLIFANLKENVYKLNCKQTTLNTEYFRSCRENMCKSKYFKLQLIANV